MTQREWVQCAVRTALETAEPMARQALDDAPPQGLGEESVGAPTGMAS